jgi:hypothetical protein
MQTRCSNDIPNTDTEYNLSVVHDQVVAFREPFKVKANPSIIQIMQAKGCILLLLEGVDGSHDFRIFLAMDYIGILANDASQILTLNQLRQRGRTQAERPPF